MGDYFAPDSWYEPDVDHTPDPFEICPEYETFVSDVSDLITESFGILNDSGLTDKKKVKMLKVFLDEWAKNEL